MHAHRACVRRLRPGEGALLEPLVEHPEARPIPDEALQSISSPVAEDEEMTRVGIAESVTKDQRPKPVHGPAHVSGARQQRDADRRREGQHERRTVRS